MRIGMIGTGNVGATLERRGAAGGHEIWFGTRDPESSRIRSLLEEIGPKARATSSAEAAGSADVVVLATPWNVTEEVVRSLGDLAGKVVMDCTNPLKPDLSGLALGHTTSAAEHVAGWAAGAKVVKAFNTTGSDNMADPDYSGQPLTMFLCGDDEESKRLVSGNSGTDCVPDT